VDLAGLRRWLDEYGRAWEQGDEGGVERLYTPDIKYYETPFSEPDVGYAAVLAYKRLAKAAQKDIHFWHEPLAATGETGIARWGARSSACRPGAVLNWTASSSCASMKVGNAENCASGGTGRDRRGKRAKEG